MSLVTFKNDVFIPITAFQNSLDFVANSCGGVYVKDFQQTASCFNALCKLLDRILLEHCYDSKTRRMKLENTLFHERIGSCGGVQFLLACQFTYTILQKKRKGSMDSNEQTNFNAIRLTQENENRLILVAGRRYLHEYGLRVLRMTVGSGDYSLPPFTIQDEISDDIMNSIRENVSFVIESSYQSTSMEESSISVEESSSTLVENNTSSDSIENSLPECISEGGISYDSVPSDGKSALPGSMPITQSPTNQTDQTFSSKSIDVCQVVHHSSVPPKLPMKMEHQSLGYEVVRTKRKTGMEKYMRKLEQNKDKSESRKMEDSFLTYQDYVQALKEERMARKLKLGLIIETDLPHLENLNKKLSEVDEDADYQQALSPTSQTIKMTGRMSPDRRCRQSVIWVRNGEEKWVKEAKQQVSSWVDGLNPTTFFPFIPKPGGNLEEVDSPNSIVLGDAGLSKSLSTTSSADLSCKPSFKYQNTAISSDISFDSALEGDVDLLKEEVVVRQIPLQISTSPLEEESPCVEKGANQGVVANEMPSQCFQSSLESHVGNRVNQGIDASEIPSQCSKVPRELSQMEDGSDQGIVTTKMPAQCPQSPLELSRIVDGANQGAIVKQIPSNSSQSPLEATRAGGGADQGAILKQIPSDSSQSPLELSHVENRVGHVVVASKMSAQYPHSPLELSRVENRAKKKKEILSYCSQSPLKLSSGANQGTFRSFLRQRSSRAHLRKQAHQILKKNNENGENLNTKAMHGGDSDATEITINIQRGKLCKQEGQVQLTTDEGLRDDCYADVTTDTVGFIHVAEVTKRDQDCNSIDTIEQRNTPKSYSAHLRKDEARNVRSNSIKQRSSPESYSVHSGKDEVRHDRYNSIEQRSAPETCSEHLEKDEACSCLSDSIEHRNAPDTRSAYPKNDEVRDCLSDPIEHRNATDTCSAHPGKHAARCGLSDSSESSALERIATIDISRSFKEMQSPEMVDKVEAIGKMKYFSNGKPNKAEALLRTESHISYANSSICTTSIHCDSIDDIIITFSSASDSEVVSSSTTSEEVDLNSVSEENMMVSHVHAHPSSFSFE